MGFKRVSMGKEEIFETYVKDCYGKRLEKWVVLKEDFVGVVKILNKKYGLGLIIKKKGDEPEDRDLDWINPKRPL